MSLENKARHQRMTSENHVIDEMFVSLVQKMACQNSETKLQEIIIIY